MVVISIFAIMTGLILAKYKDFGKNILLKNLAYDLALSIRQTQSYGVNVKSQEIKLASGTFNTFGYGYGVHFTTDNGGIAVIQFGDANKDGIYSTSEIKLASTTIQNGNKVSSLCVRIGSQNLDCSPTSLDVTFKRPDPNAIIKVNGGSTLYDYAEIRLVDSNNNIKKIIVRSTGLIDVEN